MFFQGLLRRPEVDLAFIRIQAPFARLIRLFQEIFDEEAKADIVVPKIRLEDLGLLGCPR